MNILCVVMVSFSKNVFSSKFYQKGGFVIYQKIVLNFFFLKTFSFQSHICNGENVLSEFFF